MKELTETKNIDEIKPANFVEDIILKDLKSGAVKKVQTRHPPEPSGYLHIGHVRNIMLNYGIAKDFGGVCNLRFDDTNPTKEKQEFVDSIKDDVHWLGFEYQNVFYATDYFQQNYEIAIKLIKEGKAFVCDLSPEELSKTRGTLTEGGTDSPYRNRSVDENLELFEKMKNGEFESGACCLRAKIDMKSPNINMRDPVIYRIQYNEHQRIGKSWNIYPSYDFSHPLDDALEGVTHSICGLEFEDHRPLYNWVVENSGIENKPQQIEYSNLTIKGVVIGKRHIKRFVNEKKISGFDDPRIYTLRGLKRRGVLPESLLEFSKEAGVSKTTTVCEMSFFEHFVRDDLNKVAKRVMAVLNPLKLIITNYPEKLEEKILLDDFPQNKETTTRVYKFGRELIIEREDFMENPTNKFHRLSVGKKVRLKGAYIIECTGFDKNEKDEITCVYATYDPKTKSGSGTEPEVKVKATIHWLNCNYARKIEVRHFENLTLDSTAINGDYEFNPNSLHINKNAYIEKDIEFDFEERYQFLRNGYYCLDKDSTDESLVFNRTISLRDTKKN
ncbi:MAG: glutamine--tRNA ligase/YqeY domain fusion protein [Clostridia bacterium]|nr:glutamine--tRNA ligase/YqeY domain fusion protein [Clostridia bacterium]MDD4408340.1 glutamine--tRNA ligase/YqeY domain fusion protein [Clostridia bacterium]